MGAQTGSKKLRSTALESVFIIKFVSHAWDRKRERERNLASEDLVRE